MTSASPNAPARTGSKVDVPARRLHEGLLALGMESDPGLEERLMVYLAELVRWNTAYNLTSVRNPFDMVTRHVLDSLVVLPFVRGRLLDVGSGAGLPGIPLALAVPELHVTLLDSNGKKARFLRNVQRKLALQNVEVVETRIEDFEPAVLFDTVVSRAFAALGEFLQAAVRLCAPDGRMLAMKGRIEDAELKKIPDGVRIVQTRGLKVPGLHEARHLVIAEAVA